MFSKKIVFVVGAGASHDFGMPLGIQLVGEVKAILDFRWEFGHRPIGTGKPEVLDALKLIAKNREKDINDYTRACGFLQQAIDVFPSVDNFLHSHSSNDLLVEAGKLGIASAIIHAEKNSNLYVDQASGHRFNLSQVKGTWIEKFFTIACTDVTLNGTVRGKSACR